MDIDVKFKELMDAYKAKNRAVETIRYQIMALEKEMEGISNPYDETISILKTAIETEVLCNEKSFKCKLGGVTYKREYTRASWDDKALIGYSAAHPEIEQFRKLSTIKASASISVILEE